MERGRERRRIGRALLAVAACAVLAGCESMARQDPLLMRGSTNATVFASAPIYIDRPLAENLETSLIFADYDQLLREAGLMDMLRGPGPFTVFAIVDPAVDDIPAIYRERMTDPANSAGLRRLMGYTIVPGRYTLAAIRALLAKGGGRAALPTIDHATLGFAYDADRSHILLTDPAGRRSALVLADIIQSNGLLYAGNRVLAPDE